MSDSDKSPAKKAGAKASSPVKAPVKKSAAKAPAGKAPAKAAAKAPAAKSAAKASTGSSQPEKKAATKRVARADESKSSAPSVQEVRRSKPWKRARKRAEDVLNDPERMRKIAQEATEKSEGRKAGPLNQIIDDLSALIRLVVAYARGHYREISPQVLVTVVAGLIYFVSPLDLIPDFLPGGFVDDVAVLGWVIRTAKGELEAFKQWELGRDD